MTVRRGYDEVTFFRSVSFKFRASMKEDIVTRLLMETSNEIN